MDTVNEEKQYRVLDEDDSARYRLDLEDYSKRAFVLCLQALFEMDLRKASAEEAAADAVNRELMAEMKFFVFEACDYIEKNNETIDKLVKDHITCNWTLERLAFVERNILRLGAYLMLAMPELPSFNANSGKIAMQAFNSRKAWETCYWLAREYGQPKSVNLVKAIVDSIRKDCEKAND